MLLGTVSPLQSPETHEETAIFEAVNSDNSEVRDELMKTLCGIIKGNILVNSNMR
jgi:hypothetical protein